MKKILWSILALFLIWLLYILSVGISLRSDWGHHFSFENELGVSIDSLEITVGDVKNIIVANSDGTLEGNINVPSKGYPHKVKLRVFYDGKIMLLKTPDFNCYNCDGSHMYILKKSGAIYRFMN